MPLERPRPPQRPFDTGHAGDDEQLTLMSNQMHLVTPRRWTHFLFFPDEATTRAVGAELESEWQVDVLAAPDGSGWTLQLTKDSVQVSALAVKHARRDFSELAQGRGGEYDGWRAWL
jgi:hypothetical protein